MARRRRRSRLAGTQADHARDLDGYLPAFDKAVRGFDANIEAGNCENASGWLSLAERRGGMVECQALNANKPKAHAHVQDETRRIARLFKTRCKVTKKGRRRR